MWRVRAEIASAVQSGYHPRVKRSASLIAIAVLTFWSSQPAVAAEDGGAGRIIVKWLDAPERAPQSRQQHVRELAQRLGSPFIRARNLGGRLSLLHVAAGRQAEALAALRADPEVEFAEPDQRIKALAYVPSDPLFTGFYFHDSRFYGYQWYLRSFQPAAIRAEVAWDISRGGENPASSPAVVAVIDSGIRPDHPDLAGKLLPGFDFVSDKRASTDGDGWDADPTDTGDFITLEDLQVPPFDDREQQCGGGENFDEALPSSWHGTRVAGLIGANTDNGQGMAGAGFNVRILPVRVLGKCGGYLSDVLAGMYWAAGFFDMASDLPIPAELLTDPGALKNHRNHHPAQIINMSLGSRGHCSKVYELAVREITSIGVLVVAAAGNDGRGVYQPANCPGVLAVAGLRHAGTKVGFSNLGPEVAVAAPAGNCGVSAPGAPCLYALTTLTNLGEQEPGADDYSLPQSHPSFGTSFSAPLVAATAGLMKTVNPALTPALLIKRIQETARAFPTSDELGTTETCVVPTVAPTQDVACVCTTAVCGAGMIDAGAAVQAALRPAALVKTRRLGANYILDGRASAAADMGRTIVGHAWSVTGATGGAGMPVIDNADQAVASVAVPFHGSVTVQLLVTDSSGDSDTALVTVTAGDADSSSSPPIAGVSRGGGSMDFAVLGMLCLLLFGRLASRRPARPLPRG